MNATEWKDKGNAFVKEKKYQEALDCYTEAIKLDANNHILYSNRSAMESNLEKFEDALKDAEKALEIKSDYVKGFLRKGTALKGLNKLDEAVNAFKEGLKIAPEDKQLKEGVEEIENVMKNPFMKNYGKLFTDPRTAGLMKDPQFRTLLDFAMKDQKMLIQLMQSDPRFTSVFSVLTGIDLEKMNEDMLKNKKKQEEEEKVRKEQEEARIKKEKEEAAKKAEEERWNSLTEEEKAEENNHKEADKIKAEGNEFYKQRKFEEAIKKYEEAKAKYPKELIYSLNMSKCYMELKDYDKSISICEEIVKQTNDFIKRAKAFGIIGYAYQAKNDIEKSIEYFEKAQLENDDPRIKESLKQAQKELKKKKELEYQNPEIAEEENKAANELYKSGKFTEAVSKYTEAIKRNPKLAKYLANRAAAYIKLMQFHLAVQDCDAAIALDPNYSKAYSKKINCHLILKEYFKAMECSEKGMKLFPEDAELKQLYAKTMETINNSASDNDQERAKIAAQDPEIQKILKDPRVQQLLKEASENPMYAQQSIMKDEFLRNAFKKLVAAGIVKIK